MPLPEGLTFDPDERKLSGTPTAAGEFPVTYTVTEADTAAPDSDTLSFTITVAADEAPSFAEGVDDQANTQGSAIEELPLPPASGGDGELTYTVDPDVPGLTFDAATRTLSGMPATAGDFTYDM